MATKTMTRNQQIDALIAFAKEHGYNGPVDKVESAKTKVREGETKTHKENIGYAEKLIAAMEVGKAYTITELAELNVSGIPLSTKTGKPSSQKLNAIMAAAAKAEMIDAGLDGEGKKAKKVYTRAA